MVPLTVAVRRRVAWIDTNLWLAVACVLASFVGFCQAPHLNDVEVVHRLPYRTMRWADPFKASEYSPSIKGNLGVAMLPGTTQVRVCID